MLEPPNQDWVHLGLAQVLPDCGWSSCLVLKVINQLFNYLAAPGKEAGFRHNQTIPKQGRAPSAQDSQPWEEGYDSHRALVPPTQPCLSILEGARTTPFPRGQELKTMNEWASPHPHPRL